MAEKHQYYRVIAPGSVTVPVGEANHVVVPSGAVIDVSQASPFFADHVEENAYTSSLFEKASKSDYDRHVSQEGIDPLSQDPTVAAMSVIEEITRRRSVHPVEERQGGGAANLTPARLDPGRTLPESGSDSPANDRYAQRKGADVAEGDVKDQNTQNEERGAGLGETHAQRDPKRRSQRAKDLPEGTAAVEVAKGRAKAAEKRDEAPPVDANETPASQQEDPSGKQAK
jgi:hypothetical protein